MAADGQDIDAGKRVVVVVENDEAYRYALGRDLERSGLVIREFTDGNQALDYFDGGGRVDVLLTDLRLPAGTPNGLSLALMARRRRPEIPIILTSSHDLDSMIDGELGMMVSKSKGVEDVLRCVQEAMSRSAAEV